MTELTTAQKLGQLRRELLAEKLDGGIIDRLLFEEGRYLITNVGVVTGPRETTTSASEPCLRPRCGR